MLTRPQIEELMSFRSEDAPVASLYLDVSEPSNRLARYPVRAEELLRQGRHEAERRQREADWSESKVAAAGAALEHIHAYLRNDFSADGVRGLAVFATGVKGGLLRAFPLAVPVRDRVVFQEHPYVRPLVQVLDDAPRYGVALADREKGLFFVIAQGEIVQHSQVTDDVPGRIRPESWYGLADHNIERHVDERIHQHLKHMAVVLDALVTREGLDRVLLGATPDVLPEFERTVSRTVRELARERMPHLINPTPDAVLAAAQDVVAATDRADDLALVRQTMEDAARDEYAVVGLDAVLWALYQGAVQTLIVEHDHASREGYVCQGCGRIFRMSEQAPRCPACARPAPRRVPDVVEEAVDAALLQSAEVISTDTGDALPAWERDAEGIGARLRFHPVIAS